VNAPRITDHESAKSNLFALFVFLLWRLTSSAFTIDSSTLTLRINLNYIQGVSEFDRQTLIRTGAKTLSLRHNRLKSFTNIKIQGIQIVCFYTFCRLSRKLSIFYSICIKSFMSIFDHRISPERLSVES
jgi:hypothetical protein